MSIAVQAYRMRHEYLRHTGRMPTEVWIAAREARLLAREVAAMVNRSAGALGTFVAMRRGETRLYGMAVRLVNGPEALECTA